MLCRLFCLYRGIIAGFAQKKPGGMEGLRQHDSMVGWYKHLIVYFNLYGNKCFFAANEGSFIVCSENQRPDKSTGIQTIFFSNQYYWGTMSFFA